MNADENRRHNVIMEDQAVRSQSEVERHNQATEGISQAANAAKVDVARIGAEASKYVADVNAKTAAQNTRLQTQSSQKVAKTQAKTSITTANINARTELTKANIAAQTARMNKAIDAEISKKKNKTDTNIAKMGNRVKTAIKQMDNWMRSSELSQDKKLALKRFKNELEKVILHSKPQQWYQGVTSIMKDMANAGNDLTPAAKKLAKDTEKELSKLDPFKARTGLPNPIFDKMASLYH